MNGASQSTKHPCKVLVFDLDDTLYPECDYAFSGFEAVGAWLRQHHGVPGFAEAARFHFHAGQRGNIFDLSLKKLGVPFDPSLISRLVEVYRQHQPSLRLHPDAEWALEHFRPSMRLGILTDGFLVAQQNKVTALSLESRVDRVLYSDLYGRAHWKPSPTPYLKLVEALGCMHGECVYVADNPEKDFVAPLALGWRTVQIVRPNAEYCQRQPHPSGRAAHRINSLYELRDLL